MFRVDYLAWTSQMVHTFQKVNHQLSGLSYFNTLQHLAAMLRAWTQVPSELSRDTLSFLSNIWHVVPFLNRKYCADVVHMLPFYFEKHILLQ